MLVMEALYLRRIMHHCRTTKLSPNSPSLQLDACSSFDFGQALIRYTPHELENYCNVRLSFYRLRQSPHNGRHKRKDAPKEGLLQLLYEGDRYRTNCKGFMRGT